MPWQYPTLASCIVYAASTRRSASLPAPCMTGWSGKVRGRSCVKTQPQGTYTSTIERAFYTGVLYVLRKAVLTTGVQTTDVLTTDHTLLVFTHVLCITCVYISCVWWLHCCLQCIAPGTSQCLRAALLMSVTCTWVLCVQPYLPSQSAAARL